MSTKKDKDFFGKKEGSIETGAIAIVVGVLIGICTQSRAAANLSNFETAFLIASGAGLLVYGMVNLGRALKSPKQ